MSIHMHIYHHLPLYLFICLSPSLHYPCERALRDLRPPELQTRSLELPQSQNPLQPSQKLRGWIVAAQMRLGIAPAG